MSDPQNGSGEPTVFVVDDDQAMRDGLSFLMKSAGLRVRCFDSAQSFLNTFEPSMGGCVLLDVRMPGMTGLQLQELLRSRQITIPVIILTAYADVPMAVRAMRGGAFDFFEKPFDDTKLIDRIRQAMDSAARTQWEDERVRHIEQCMAKLTPREHEVMELVVTGALNKEIADMLNISVKTVENHRARVMEKMEAEYLADLVRMAMRVGIE